MSDKVTRQKLLLGLLGLVLVATLWYQFRDASLPDPAAAARGGAQARPAATGATQPVQVGLDRLKAERPAPANAGRNPFRFGTAPAPPPAAGPSSPATAPGGMGPVVAMPTGPLPPPPPPPIPFKFIGLLTPAPGDKVAVLSDGRTVVHGRAGDVIEGRYRLLSVADEAVQMEYLDGRGRRTIRLSGA